MIPYCSPATARSCSGDTRPAASASTYGWVSSRSTTGWRSREISSTRVVASITVLRQTPPPRCTRAETRGCVASRPADRREPAEDQVEQERHREARERGAVLEPRHQAVHAD